MERARAGDGVTLIEALTYRRRGHAQHDDQRYQPKDEIARWEANDPVDRYVARVTEAGWVGPQELAAAERRADATIDHALEECEGDPLPAPATALSGVYAAPPAASPLWFRRLDG